MMQRYEKHSMIILRTIFIAAALYVFQGCIGKEGPPDQDNPILVWHGLDQKVGHLGFAQPDFNVLGTLSNHQSIVSLTCVVNGGEPLELTIARGPFGDTRRLAAPGNFNADIPLSTLRAGVNTVVLTATDSLGNSWLESVNVTKQDGESRLPRLIEWSNVKDPQDVGQFVDGLWGLEDEGLRTLRTGYDRVFLIGDTSWIDYEVTVPFVVNHVDSATGPVSGGNGLGILMRFQGHVNGGPRNFPVGQPKWGYQPFGAIGFLRWKDGVEQPPVRQFYRGDKNAIENYGPVPIVAGNKFWMKMVSKTQPDRGNEGVTLYSFKIWEDGSEEPASWDWEVEQQSEHALRKGGVVLLAHHVDVTFGDVRIDPN